VCQLRGREGVRRRLRSAYPDQLLWVGRDHAEPGPRQRVDPFRIGERRLLQPESMVLLFQCGLFGLALFNLIAVPHALEMLPCEYEHKRKNQYAQPQETETFTATLRVNFPRQAGIVDVLHKIKFREIRSTRGRDVSRTPSGLR